MLYINFLSKSLVKSALLILFFSGVLLCGQYEMDIKDVNHSGANELEFNITIRGVENPFTLTSYQVSLALANLNQLPDDVQFSYVENSTQLSNSPSYGVHASNSDGKPEVTFAALPGTDTIMNEALIVGTFKITSVSVDLSEVNLKWDFEGINSTIILGDDFLNITSPANHLNLGDVTGLDNFVEKPSVYSLSQNYPNPFNPSTVISFSLQKDSRVNLSVYNILGQLVTTLVNDNLDAGSHQIQFNAANLASGVYLYHINADDFSETRKMILQK